MLDGLLRQGLQGPLHCRIWMHLQQHLQGPRGLLRGDKQMTKCPQTSISPFSGIHKLVKCALWLWMKLKKSLCSFQVEKWACGVTVHPSPLVRVSPEWRHSQPQASWSITGARVILARFRQKDEEASTRYLKSLQRRVGWPKSTAPFICGLAEWWPTKLRTNRSMWSRGLNTQN